MHVAIWNVSLALPEVPNVEIYKAPTAQQYLSHHRLKEVR